MSNFLSSEAARFFLVGGFNTIAGYFIGVGVYLLLSSVVHLALISVLASGVSVAISFMTQRFLVFFSNDPWWPQFRRSVLVYGCLALAGTPLLWFLLEVIRLSIWRAQAIMLVVGAVFSYAGQKWFTFKV